MEGRKIDYYIFRAYDVRGVFPKDIDADVARRIGNAFAATFVKKECVVGMDGRLSGPELREALIMGITDAGMNVIDAGLCPRSACIFIARERKLTSAYVTASHLPKEWNGIKFADAEGIELQEEENYRVRDVVLDGSYRKAAKPGRVVKADALCPYKRFLLSRLKRPAKPLKVAIDCGNGVGGLAAPELFRELGFGVDALFADVDGRFPNRPSEIDEKSLGGLKKRVGKADIGIAYDGDADRMVLMDEKGRMLGPETTSFIIMQELAGHEKGPIIANVECLRLMDEIGKRYGREVIRIRVGNSFMVQDVIRRKACFGVERSGHFCIPSIIPMDDGMAASMYAAYALSRSGKKLSEIVDSLPQYPFQRRKVDCPEPLKAKVIAGLKESLAKEGLKVNALDGVRVDFDHGWVLIRPSNTEAIMRLSVEAEDDAELKALTARFLAMLKSEIASLGEKASD